MKKLLIAVTLVLFSVVIHGQDTALSTKLERLSQITNIPFDDCKNQYAIDLGLQNLICRYGLLQIADRP